jgi:glycosyltransferase involved in cell wall biosynthesis
MRISLVSEHANPLAALGGADAGGQNVHVAALAEGLARRGHDVVVHTRRDNPAAPTTTIGPGGYMVQLVPAGPPTDVPKDDLLPHMPAFARHLARQWRTTPPDVVHAHFWMSGLAARDATRGTGVPMVQTFHALGAVKRRQQGVRDTSPKVRVDLERRLCTEADHVIATCRDEVTELGALGLPEERADVVPCGVDLNLFPAHAPRRGGGHRLLVIGRLVMRKGVGNVIEALADLPGAELTVAGGPSADALGADPEAARLMDLADQLGVSERVRFVGGVGREDVPVLMGEADLVVTVPWYEPFGIVPLEAMASARPVVGSAVGGLLDTVVPGVTGDLVPPRRPDLLADSLRGLLGNPRRRAEMGRQGRRRVETLFSWERVVARHEQVYAEVAARHEGAVLTTTARSTR